MAEFNACPTLNFTVTMILTEKEARALLYLSSFGPTQVTSWIIPKVGQSRANDTQEGLISILEDIQLELKGQIFKIDQARDLINHNS
jgi:hypothetical protein